MKNIFMKQLILVTLALLPFSLLAQKVDKKTGTILYKGSEVGTVEKSGGLAKSFTLYDESGEEIASFNPQPNNPKEEYYEIFFARTDNKGTCPGNLGFANKIAKAYVKSNIMKDGNYKPSREAQFISVLMGKYYGGNVLSKARISEKTDVVENDLLERNRDAAIQVVGNKAEQDFKKIASIKKSQQATRGTVVVRYKIYNHKGTQIAEATADGVMNTEFKVVTLKDNKTHFVTTESTIYNKRDLIQLLVDNYYL